MATIVRKDSAKAKRLAKEKPTALVVAVGPLAPGDLGVAEIGIRVAHGPLAAKLQQAIAGALDDEAAIPLDEARVVRVGSRMALDRLGAGVEGAFAIVPITARNLRRVGETVEGLRRARAAGVQLVWDGCDPPRDVAEPKVFAILERARATPADPPVLLSATDELVESLRIAARPATISTR